MMKSKGLKHNFNIDDEIIVVYLIENDLLDQNINKGKLKGKITEIKRNKITIENKNFIIKVNISKETVNIKNLNPDNKTFLPENFNGKLSDLRNLK